MIGYMATIPVLLPQIIFPELIAGPIVAAEGTFGLRIAPIQCLALLLVAWHFRWRHVVGFCLGTGIVNIGFMLIHHPARPSLRTEVVITLYLILVLLVFGYCGCLMTTRIRHQTQALADANALLRHYASTLERLAVSRERNRVARELHDTLAHTLTGLTVELETIKAYWSIDPATANTLIESALVATRAGVQETRRALDALRASPLEEQGLRMALCQMVHDGATHASLHLDLRVAAHLPLLLPDVEQCLYRVAQEAVTNVTQHANAQHIAVHLTADDERLTLIVQDDGCGFAPSHDSPANHFGLVGMRERAYLAGGQLTIISAVGQGTTIKLVI